MSVVTNLIIVVPSSGRDAKEPYGDEEILICLRQCVGNRGKLEYAPECGDKYVEGCNVVVAAFNHFDLAEFFARLRRELPKWLDYPQDMEEVQVFVKEQEEDVFTERFANSAK